MSYVNTDQLGTDHREWLNKLDFYKDDLVVLNKRLTEIASKNTSTDASAGIEHFQNQFIIQRNNIDELKHMINESAHEVFVDAKDHKGRVHTDRIAQYNDTEEKIKAFEKVMKELRSEFQSYSAKWI
ncbi:MAG TPA: hypothetical protein VMT76_02580 [Puia sp.]|nr:hypothetical protein [Puia sp.]